MDAQENQIYLAILIASVLIGAIIFFFIFSIIQQHKKVLALERKNANAEITVLEKDRARIAADLHDDLAPMLSAVKMKINSFDLENLDDQQHLTKTNNTIDEIAKRMRAISFDLMPTSLKEKGLITAMQEFVNLINNKNTINIKLLIPDEDFFINEQRTIHTYRIFQEIIQNTLKHAQASSLNITLAKKNNRLILLSQDNGVGFDYEKQLKEGLGLGLHSLLNRTTLLGAEFSIESEPGNGTICKIEIPLEIE